MAYQLSACLLLILLLLTLDSSSSSNNFINELNSAAAGCLIQSISQIHALNQLQLGGQIERFCN